MSGLKPTLREQEGGVLDTNTATFREIVETVGCYEQFAQDKQVQAGTVHAVGAGGTSAGGGGNCKRSSGGQTRGKTMTRPGWVKLKELLADVCFNCCYSSHQAATCSVPLEKQVWDATLKRLGLQKKKGCGGPAPAASNTQQPVHSANLIDVVAQQQQ